MGRGSPISCDLQVSLTVEQDPEGTVTARLVADEQDGLLVEVEFTGDELALLLAGETIAVPALVSGPEQPDTEQPDTEQPDTEQPDTEQPDTDEPVIEPDVVVPESAPDQTARSGTDLDEPPVGTEPIARSTDVRPGEAVLAYIHGRWRDAVVVRRDIGSLLVSYTRPGSFGRVQQRIATERVRRRLGE
ncbi:hypothetical protein FHX44_112067 [Pseudonocardia hierapolitana]|uniref:Uncharacterized protein n=2 Tax=Pseudonocardia hierapolitana TaxID=1128676 RepID=A0A561SMU0_9PSEU|nr:hypothetical protein FHX44_112067 [Pseudonocardia hierapolitana]